MVGVKVGRGVAVNRNWGVFVGTGVLVGFGVEDGGTGVLVGGIGVAVLTLATLQLESRLKKTV